jgi:hypothetical protein
MNGEIEKAPLHMAGYEKESIVLRRHTPYNLLQRGGGGGASIPELRIKDQCRVLISVQLQSNTTPADLDEWRPRIERNGITIQSVFQSLSSKTIMR